MNPGTVLFIIIGIIGLMLYVLQALKISSNNVSEGFSNILNLDTLKEDDMESLAKALGFPESDTIKQIQNMNNDGIPMTSQMPMDSQMPMASQMPTTSQMPMAQNMTSDSQMSLPPYTRITPQINVATYTQKTIEDVKKEELDGKPQTISDYQGIDIAINQEKEARMLKKSMMNALDNKTDDSKKVKRKKKYKCPPMPDMSLYIRKDQIPCWGCNLK